MGKELYFTLYKDNECKTVAQHMSVVEHKWTSVDEHIGNSFSISRYNDILPFCGKEYSTWTATRKELNDEMQRLMSLYLDQQNCDTAIDLLESISVYSYILTRLITSKVNNVKLDYH